MPSAKRKPMSANEFKTLIAGLGLSIYGAAKPLGISLRHAYRYSNGETEIPQPVAKLLRLVVRTKTDPNSL